MTSAFKKKLKNTKDGHKERDIYKKAEGALVGGQVIGAGLLKDQGGGDGTPHKSQSGLHDQGDSSGSEDGSSKKTEDGQGTASSDGDAKKKSKRKKKFVEEV